MHTDEGGEMTSAQNRNLRIRGHLGFSMIDVLVAIVVLATGLLALAVLQGALTRNSADARARSQVGAYTESVIDRMRSAGWDTTAPSTAFAEGDTITPSSSCSGSLTLKQTMQCDANTAQTAAGISGLSTAITTAKLYCGTSGGTFATGSSCTSDQATYKQLKLTTSWTDATGATRTLTFDTTVSPVTSSPSDNTLDSTNFSALTGNSPTMREANPGRTLGVIPIAVVTGSTDAAATNPKPVVTNTGTTFTTLTYAASNADLTKIEQRVDTKVIQCSCKFTASGGAVSSDSNLLTILKQPYGPTYWDGTQYVSPAKATADSSTGKSATGVDTTATQDASCDICCRDRNDNVGNKDTSGNTVLFDNTGYSASTTKFAYVNGVLTDSQNTGPFVQACRMIRVGGVYAAATDAHLNFFGMLTTSNCAAESTPAPTGCSSNLLASDTVPTSTTETSYGNFVKAYLNNYFTDLKTNGKPSVTESDPLLSDAGANLYNGSPYQLNLPTQVASISLPNTIGRWVYARGIYIDHLETLAKTALANAITSCPGTSSIEDCALPILPFTTINMSELANWTTSNTSVIHISNTAVIGGDETSPKRGNVTVPSTQNGSSSPTAYAVATAYVTNSGLTAVSTNQANSTYDYDASTTPPTTHTVTDQRQFAVTGSGGGGSSAVYFDVALSGLDWISSISSSNLVPSISWSGTAAQLGTAASGSSNGYATATTTGHGSNSTTTYAWLYAGASATTPIPVSASNTPPVGLTINVQNFNTTDNNGTVSNVTCGATSNNSFSNLTRCLNYQVDYGNITVNGTNAGVTAAMVSLMSGTTNGGLKEGATISLPASPGISSTTNTIAGATALIIPFTLEGTSTPSGTCSATTTCQGNGGNNCTTTNTYTQSSCPN